MVNLMRFRPIVLMHKTVFATFVRPFNHQPAQRIGDVRAWHQNQTGLAEKWLAAPRAGFEPRH